MRCARLVSRALVGVLLISGCASTGANKEPAERSVLRSEDLSGSDESIEQILQKRVPGLLVTRTPDGGIALEIRNPHSYRGEDMSPLYILNGMPYIPGAGGALTGIDPRTIESIKVLKGSEAALYGISGSNGVIVVTTKMPGKSKS